MESEDRPADEQVKRIAKLLSWTGLNSKNTVCCITFMVYPFLLHSCETKKQLGKFEIVNTKPI